MLSGLLICVLVSCLSGLLICVLGSCLSGLLICVLGSCLSGRACVIGALQAVRSADPDVYLPEVWRQVS